MTCDEFEPGARHLVSQATTETIDVRLQCVRGHTFARQADFDTSCPTAAQRQLGQRNELQHVVEDGGPVRTELLRVHWALGSIRVLPKTWWWDRQRCTFCVQVLPDGFERQYEGWQDPRTACVSMCACAQSSRAACAHIEPQTNGIIENYVSHDNR